MNNTTQTQPTSYEDPWRLVEEMRKKILYLRNNMPQWKYCEHQMPDTDATVLVYCPESVEPVWLGFYDGEDWRSIDSIRLPEEVTHWMEPPEPPEFVEDDEE
ncbi:MAG TPA: DUF551 domain-containing protein [Chthoniobacteraceae bacterium]|nr:DUF551 domain-containing protein [Chthoniobacteraceae bacterium]